MDINGKYSVGKIFKNKKGEEFEIIEYISYMKRKIKFLINVYEKIINVSSIRNGNVLNSNSNMYSLYKIFNNNNGEEFEIINIIDRNKREIRFIETNYKNIVTISEIKKGLIRDNSTFVYKYDIGTKFKTNEGYDIQIIERVDNVYRKVKFLDKYGYEGVYQISAIIGGRIKNPYHPSVYGIGFYGDGNFVSKVNDKSQHPYSIWQAMLRRCYSLEYHITCPTYVGTTVCEEWHNFQNFAKWYEENHPYHIEGIKFQIDKDLLQQGVENKVYSPNTCVFLPDKVNSFLSVKPPNKASMCLGVTRTNRSEKWIVQISDFEYKKNTYLGTFCDLEEAKSIYKLNREIQAGKVRRYMEDLNYLQDDIIKLIK